MKQKLFVFISTIGIFAANSDGQISEKNPLPSSGFLPYLPGSETQLITIHT